MIQDRLRAAARKRAILDSISGDRGEERRLPFSFAIRRTEEGLLYQRPGSETHLSPALSAVVNGSIGGRHRAGLGGRGAAAEMCNRKEARIILPDQSYEWWSRKNPCCLVTNEDDVIIESER